MTKARLEAFSDGVIAIIITIMVLELKVPHGTDWASIKPIFPVLVSYVISFIMIGIYWGNHHHLLHTVTQVSSKIIWANLHLLFWLSLVPFVTAWAGETAFNCVPVAIYALLLDLCGTAYYILLRTIVKSNHYNDNFSESLEKQSKKGMLSAGCYTLAIPLAFVHPGISGALFILVAIFWWIPDRNIEQLLK